MRTAVRSPSKPGILLAGLSLLASLALLYWQVVAELVSAWASDGNYSHGFLILPFALYFAWARRDELRAAERRPSLLGLVVVLGSLAIFVAGILGAELFLTRASMIGVTTGAILFTLGWKHLRILAWALAFTLLMIPIPSIVFNQIAFPLQLLAARFGEFALQLCEIPVLREGNVIVLASTSLEVADACSGIRSLVSLLTLGIVVGYFADRRAWVRMAIAILTVPIAIVTNGGRVAGTGIATHYFGPEVASGAFHEVSGLLVFVAALALLFFALRLILFIAPQRDLSGQGTQAVAEQS